jgi:hypothetical protein
LFYTNGLTLALTLDASQNATFAGDVDVGGDLTLGASGCNKTWESPLLRPGQEVIGGSSNPPSAIATKVYASNRREIPVATCDDSTNTRLLGVISMPDDYDGSVLEYDIYFTVANTNSGNVHWYVLATADDAGDDLSSTAIGTSLHTEAAPGVVDQLVTATGTVTPNSTADLAGQLVYFSVVRLGADALDTYTTSGDDVYFIGVKFKYA